jgi:hypothetical protein
MFARPNKSSFLACIAQDDLIKLRKADAHPKQQQISIRGGTMKRLEMLYLKYIVKSAALFYAFLLLFVGILLFAALTVKLDVLASFPASLEGDAVIIRGVDRFALHGDQIYYYNKRNDEVQRAEITQVAFGDEQTDIYLHRNEEELSGEITFEVVVGEQTLLARIFGKAGMQ